MAKAKKSLTAATKQKKSTKHPKSAAKRIIRREPINREQFFTVKITDQSLYWLIFGIVAILFALWVYTLDARVRDLYDQIDMTTSNEALYDLPMQEPSTPDTTEETLNIEETEN